MRRRSFLQEVVVGALYVPAARKIEAPQAHGPSNGLDKADVAQRAGGCDWRSLSQVGQKNGVGPLFPFGVITATPKSSFGLCPKLEQSTVAINRQLRNQPLEPAPYFHMDEPEPFDGKKDLNPRGEKLLKILSQDRKFKVDEIKAMTFGTYVVPADVFAPRLSREPIPLYEIE
jgi:hypothetical protein